MANEQNQLPTPKDIEPDTPTAEDGAGEGGLDLRPAQQKLGDEPPASEEQREPQQWKDEKRAAIFAKSRERTANYREYGGDPNDASITYGDDNAAADDMDDLEREAMERARQSRQKDIEKATGQTQPAAQQQQDGEDAPYFEQLDPVLLQQKVTLKIDGKPVRVTFEEALRHRQMHGAAENRLEHAKQLARQAQELVRNATPAPGSPQTTGQDQRRDNPFDAPPAGRNTSAPPVDKKALIERIQIGTPEEALEAFDQILESARVSQQPADDTTRVLTVLEDRNSEDALKRFAEKHPEIRDETLASLVTENVRTVMATDLINAGYSPDYLRTVITSPDDLTRFHKMQRINRVPGIRSTGDVLEIALSGAKQKISELSGVLRTDQGQGQQRGTTSAPATPTRQQRKAALPAQPAQRTAVRTPAQTQQVSVEQSRANAVARIRQGRGQHV